MAYTRGVETDLFITYAHDDNKADWVTRFHGRLQDRFGELLGHDAPKVVVWRDPKLDTTNVVTPEILDRLKRTAVFLSVATPSCMTSPWCRDERNKFAIYAAQNGGLTIGTKTRAVYIIKTPLLGSEPHPFDTLTLDFYELNQQSGKVDEFLPHEGRFEKRINDLAQDLLKLFDTLSARPVPAPKDAVFVALTPRDTRPTREKIVQELDALGFAVLPPDDFSVEDPGFSREIDGFLSKCKLAVHFSGNSLGVTPDGESKPLTVLQFDLASDHSLPRIVWVEPGTSLQPAFQAALVAGGQLGTEIVNNPLQNIGDLKRLIVTSLGDLQAPPLESESKLNIYMLCDTVDYPSAPTEPAPNLARVIYAFLTQRGYAVWLPLIGAKSEQERIDDHHETLKMSDAVLVMWGNTDEAWFRRSARELASIQVERAARPLRSRALVLGAPPSNKDQYRGFLDVAIDLFGGFSPDKFAPFEQQLKA